jgi:hypothetical protein
MVRFDFAGQSVWRGARGSAVSTRDTYVPALVSVIFRELFLW